MSVGKHWNFCIIFFVIGDLVTTIIGVGFFNMYEINPIVRELMNLNILLFIPYKLISFTLIYYVIQKVGFKYEIVFPIVLGFMGLIATINNGLIILNNGMNV